MYSDVWNNRDGGINMSNIFDIRLKIRWTSRHVHACRCMLGWWYFIWRPLIQILEVIRDLSLFMGRGGGDFEGALFWQVADWGPHIFGKFPMGGHFFGQRRFLYKKARETQFLVLGKNKTKNFLGGHLFLATSVGGCHLFLARFANQNLRPRP